jgi:tRNA(Ile)-lysidine synthase TilS/MesJ
LKICKKCVLPDTFPGVHFRDDCEVCKYCCDYNALNYHDSRINYKERFVELVSKVKGENKDSFDVLMLYSGGKDSTYTLKLLREVYKLRVRALVFNNHFISPQAWKNIHQVCAELDVDLYIDVPDEKSIKKLFLVAAKEELFSKKALERASNICSTCSALFKGSAFKHAVKNNIPLIAAGWSPGQVPIQSAMSQISKNFLKLSQRQNKDIINGVVEGFANPWFLTDEEINARDEMPWSIYPLAYHEYNEENVLLSIKELGWENPKDTDSNSTNCLLNAYANQNHIDRYGFHPYVLEIANMVRNGNMIREKGLEKIYSEQNQKLIDLGYVKLLNVGV